MLSRMLHSPWRHRRILVTALVSALVAASFVAVHLTVGAGKPVATGAPAARPGLAVHVHVVRGRRVHVPAMKAWRHPVTSWPQAGGVTVAVPAPGPRVSGRAGADPRAGSARAGRTPVWVGQPDVARPPGVSRVRVSVSSPGVARALGMRGLVLSVGRADGAARAGRVRVSVSYSGFAQAYGGDYGSRLRLVRLPACALSRPSAAACRRRTPLGSVNDARRHWVSADVPVASASAPATVLALVAGPSGSAGSFAAEPMSEASAWVNGASSGAYTWSYPITVPPVPGKLAPSVALSYDSQATSGLTSSTNNQASWVGDGWNYSPGYIEADYTTCAQDAGQPATGDLCPNGEHVVLSLNGVTTVLVNGGGKWVAQADGGQTIKQSGNSWEVIEPNGVQYYFGLNQLPGYTAGDPVTNSLWTVPVWEGCGQAAFCTLPWRYNLDYAVDPHGNAIAYFYNTQANYYAEQNGTAGTGAYTQGGVLASIEYGFRAGQAYTTTPAAQITFTSAAGRSDAPTDLTCASGAACSVTSPTFWSTEALTGISTQALVGSAVSNVDSWTLADSYPATGDPTTSPSLWLSSVTRSGQDGSTPVTLPPVTFAGTPLPNRVQTPADTAAGYSELTRTYLTGITSDTGAVTTIAYSPADPAPCAAGSFPAPAANTAACYPDYWTPPGATAPVQDWFNLYTMTGLTQSDGTSGDPPVVTSYTYAGPAWHYDTGTISRSATVTWDQYRGYRTVTTETGTAPDPVTETAATYLQGMSQAGPPSNPGPTVTVTTSRGQQVTDLNQFAGQTLEQITYDGAGTGQEVTDNVSLPWTSSAIAVNTGLDQAAYLTGTNSALTYTPLSGGGTRESIDNYTYNANGLQASDSSIPDTANPAEDTCTDTTYAANTGTGLINLPATVTVDTGACNASGNGTGALVAQTENFYDGQSLGVAATAGNLTKNEQATAVATFAVTTSTYDQYGRNLTTVNPDGNTTSTAYTPATGAEPTSVAVTDPMGLVTTTSYDPARDLPLTVTDPSGGQTVKAYDALGRVTSEWTPGNPVTGPAVDTYSYTVSTTAPTVTTEQVEEPGGNYLTTQTLDDSFGNVREVQQETAGGGTDITDTSYNSDGLKALTSDPYYVSGAPSGTLVTAPSSSVPSQTGYTYDGDGRVVAQIAYKNGTETWETDTSYGGNYTTVVPPSGGTSQTTFIDGRGLTSAIYQYHSGVPANPSDPASDYDATTYTYTPARQLASITDAAGNHWAFGYDLLGDQLSQTTPDAGTSTSSYDAAGHLTSVTDARGKTTSYAYDNDGRKIGEYDTTGGAAETSADQIASWTWDTLAKGKLTSSTSQVNGAQYTEQVTGYTSGGQVAGMSTVIPSAAGTLAGVYTQQFGYAPTGQETSYTDSAAGGLPAETVSTGYDSAGEAKSLAGAASYVTSLSYTTLGQPLQYTMGTAAEPVYITDSWDPQTGRLSEQNTQTGPSQASIDDLHYSYDNYGNVTSEADTPAGASGATDVQCFQNDYLGRLVQAWAQGTTGCAAAPSPSAEGGAAPYWNSYSYDATGNLTGMTSTTPAGAVTTTTGTYPAAGGTQPHAITSQQTTGPSGAATSSYAYDKAGHLTSAAGGGQNQAYTWNDPGQLAQDAVTAASGGTAQNSTYVYDANGTLLIENDPGTTTLYLGDEELSLNTSTGSVTGTRYYTIDGGVIATRTGTGSGTGSVAYLAGDSQGTDSVAIDAASLNVTRRYYDPYGNPRGAAAASFPAGQKGFVGGTNDAATGLTNLGAREYQPALGAFISTDAILNPTDPQDLNPYSYAKGNPATASDPSGASSSGSGSGPNYNCAFYQANTPAWYRCMYKYYDQKTGCYSNNITTFHNCEASHQSSNSGNSNNNGSQPVKHCAWYDVPCQLAAIAAAGVAGGICTAVLAGFGAICSGVAAGVYNLITYLLGGNSQITAKQAAIEFATGFATVALTFGVVVGLLKVAALTLEKVGIAVGLAAKLESIATKVVSMGGHSKQSFLAWINHIL